MANLLQLSGSQAQKQTRFSPIYTGRWSSGIWTNRSPLRDANTTRLVEKFYGPAGDALIAGSNTEITNRLTLARRPGNPVFDSNTWSTILSFYEFHKFSTSTESIEIMVDEVPALYSLVAGIKTLVWTKNTGAGQTFMQSVGNTLYFGNGVDQKKWLNTNLVWTPLTLYTAPTTGYNFIIDPNGNIQVVGSPTGTSGSTMPTWSTVVPNSGNGFIGGSTGDGSVTWLNKGPALQNWGIATTGLSQMDESTFTVQGIGSGSLTTANGGWRYSIALVNSIDNTVSSCTPLSAPTGNHANFLDVLIPAGSGINPALIDPQADYVAIYRTTDGETMPFLIPPTTARHFHALTQVATVPLAVYLATPYVDNTFDTGLNNQIQGDLNGYLTPPLQGAINLTYHLNRIFFSIGNVVYWTSGPDAPSGNGVNGVFGLNFQAYPSLVVRIQPTGIGAIVFTVSDSYIITGLGTASSPIQSTQNYVKGLGLANYNALDMDGSIIGLFTTDRQFVILDPSAGVVSAGYPIGDQLRLDNNTPGQTWNPATVYVTAYIEGEDHAFYVGDKFFGWYRLMPTPAPETGYTWSPFASIVGGISAIANLEVTPGVHNLLIGPRTSGPILHRDTSYSIFTDNGTAYNANAVIGSAVLAQPGQVGQISFITTDSVRVGTPLYLGVILDEALPYYTGPFDILNVWVPDPPDLKDTPSLSLFNQRFYMAEEVSDTLVAECRHLQISVNFGVQTVGNELLALTLFGCYRQEE